MSELTQRKLAQLLTDAEAAHAEYEQTLGYRDTEWAEWYADYIVKRLNEDNN